MTYCRYLFVAILVISANANALQSKIEISEQFDNLRAVALIDKKDIISSPEWDPNLSPIPLTVGGAVQAVREFIGATKTLGAITEIEIRPLPRHKKHWHYLIKIANDIMTTKYELYVVLMDGKVIPAIFEPQGVK